MKALDRKLYRDLLKMKGQSLAIAMVLAAGVAMFIMSVTTYQSLYLSRQEYYQTSRFADVFASLKQAPLALVEKIEAIPGVTRVQTRVVKNVALDLDNVAEIATGHLVSIEIPYAPGLNDPFLRKGRFPAQGKPDEIMINEAFAQANRLTLGDTVKAVINGRKRTLEIVAIVLSPEFIYPIKPGEVFPDNLRFGIFWMELRTLSAAFNLEGAFNDVSLKVEFDASLPEIIAQLNHLLEPYGGLEALPRADQTSNWFLSNELAQLKNMGLIIPAIFFLVAIFLLNITLSRIIRGQREQIGALKAFGYSDRQVGFHYVKFVLAILMLGLILGLSGGAWMGKNLTQLYATFYQFPVLQYHFSLQALVLAVLASMFAALLGTLKTVAKAAKLPPAEAMKPEPPPSFGKTIFERMGLGPYMPTQLNMILRHMERQLYRSLAAIAGIALAVAILVVGRFNVDSIHHLMEVQFQLIQRQDLSVSFYLPHEYGALFELQAAEGAAMVEPFRSVPVKLHSKHHYRRTAILGIQQLPKLQRPLDRELKPIPLPRHGLILGRKLAEVLEVLPGDTLVVQVLEGKRRVMNLPVAGLVDEFIGSNVYMHLEELNRTIGEDRVISGAYLKIDKPAEDKLVARLKASPHIAATSFQEAAIKSFEKTIAQNINTMTFFTILFSCIIAFGVVYNSAQMILAERSRDLATLRVLGFTRAEISSILLGELAILTLAAIPLGFVMGYGLCVLVTEGMQTELIRLPMEISRATFGLAALTIMISSLFSGLVVRRKLDRLDLMAVLKTRE